MPATRETTRGRRASATWRGIALVLVVGLSASACRLPYVPGFTSPPPAAVAHLADASGKVVGNAVMLQDGSSVRILLDVSGMTSGTRAVHIHSVGRCDPPSFESAGPHFNPSKAEHGSQNPKGPHGGDLPNIVVDASGKGHLEFTAKGVSLEKGSKSLFDGAGSAVVMHERADDLRTDPDGASGARVACGVVIRAE
jgi:Cu-Zn family superoxide dismutase